MMENNHLKETNVELGRRSLNMLTNLERAEREFKTLKQKYFSQGEMMETA
jgi:hypothetical protein